MEEKYRLFQIKWRIKKIEKHEFSIKLGKMEKPQNTDARKVRGEKRRN